MTHSNSPKATTIARVVHDARQRSVERATSLYGKRFARGEAVRALMSVKNDGVYPHRDIGEVLVSKGDAGFVREDWSFLGEIYYTVEFVSRAVVVIMRGREMERAASC